MVKLRHPAKSNRLNELNRIVWFGILLLISGTATIIVSTNFFNESILTTKNILPISILLTLLVFYIYILIKFIRNFKNKANNNELE